MESSIKIIVADRAVAVKRWMVAGLVVRVCVSQVIGHLLP